MILEINNPLSKYNEYNIVVDDAGNVIQKNDKYYRTSDGELLSDETFWDEDENYCEMLISTGEAWETNAVQEIKNADQFDIIHIIGKIDPKVFEIKYGIQLTEETLKYIQSLYNTPRNYHY